MFPTFLPLSSIASPESFFTEVGITVPKSWEGEREPVAHSQRYRGDEFASSLFAKHKPFFQWYYIYVRDVLEKRAWAFTYSMSRCAGKKHTTKDCLYEGSFPGFIMIPPSSAALNYAEKHPLTAWNASASTQDVHITGGNTSLLLTADDSGNHI